MQPVTPTSHTIGNTSNNHDIAERGQNSRMAEVKCSVQSKELTLTSLSAAPEKICCGN